MGVPVQKLPSTHLLPRNLAADGSLSLRRVCMYSLSLYLYILLMIRAASRFVKKFLVQTLHQRLIDKALRLFLLTAIFSPFPRSTRYPANAVICATNASFCKYGFVSPIVPSDALASGTPQSYPPDGSQSLLSLFTFLRMDSETSYEPVPIRTRRQNACRFANTSSI